MTQLAIDLQHISKSYKAGDRDIQVLNDVTLAVPQGQFVAIMGPSGSGKSTLLQIIGCLDHPSRGSVQILGRDASSMTDDEASALRAGTMGFVFQAFHLLPAYDAVSNVALSMVYSGVPDGRPRARALLEQLGLGHRLNHRPAALSGGEKQRVAIARAIANNPEILLADEPTGALDQVNGRAILDLLASYHQTGKTVVLVTHDLSIAQRAERVVEIVDGDVKRDGPAHLWKN